MLRLLTGTLKVLLVFVLALVLGNWLHYRSRSLSDHVRVQMGHWQKGPAIEKLPEELPRKIRGWATGLAASSGSSPDSAADAARLAGERIPQRSRDRLKKLLTED